jgi:phage baseplate assembly protein gpV
MNSLFNTIRQIIQEELRKVFVAELGIVQEVHPRTSEDDVANYACTVVLRDSALVLQAVPVASARTGIVSLPAVGDLVLVQFIGGDINAPIITGSLYNEEDRSPIQQAQQTIVHLPKAAADDQAVHVELNSGDLRQLIIKLGNTLTCILQDDEVAVQIQLGSDNEPETYFQIKRNGEINIKGQAINIEATNDLNIKTTEGNMNLEATQENMNLNTPQGNINLN